MKSFLEFIQERIDRQFLDHDEEPVLQNPSLHDLVKQHTNSKNKSLRWLSVGENVYTADAYHMTHDNMMHHIGVDSHDGVGFVDHHNLTKIKKAGGIQNYVAGSINEGKIANATMGLAGNAFLRYLYKRMVKKERSINEDITLQYHDELNPKLWTGNNLNPKVREKLLDVAHEWIEFCKTPEDLVLDILITGGNANYNYTPFSDIDLHVLINIAASGHDAEYFRDKKQLWAFKYKVTILGYDIETYMQDVTETPHPGQGVFSIKNNTWVQMPQKVKVDWKDNTALIQQVEFYKQAIDNIVNLDLGNEAYKVLWDKIAHMRKGAIHDSGEFALENLVFKELRNEGYLEKMTRYIQSWTDRRLSYSEETNPKSFLELMLNRLNPEGN